MKRDTFSDTRACLRTAIVSSWLDKSSIRFNSLLDDPCI
jgi:hypothetical protein